MSGQQARTRQDYDFLIKLLLIGDSGELLPLTFDEMFVHDTGCAASSDLSASLDLTELLRMVLQVSARAACCCGSQRTLSPLASSRR